MRCCCDLLDADDSNSILPQLLMFDSERWSCIKEQEKGKRRRCLLQLSNNFIANFCSFVVKIALPQAESIFIKKINNAKSP